MEQAEITIRAESPLVMAAVGTATTLTESKDCISGAVVRGALAEAYIKRRGVADDDEGFRRLFFGGLRFADACPVKGGRRAVALPLSLYIDKAGREIRDLLREDNEPGFKAWRGLGVVNEAKGSIAKLNLKKNVALHIGRNGENERIAGRSEEGHIYNYEAIPAGTEFIGGIIGEKDDIVKLKNALDGGKLQCLLGRSRHTQYGKCHIAIGPAREIPLPLPTADNRIYLRLDTPLLPAGSMSIDAAATLKRLAEAISPDGNIGVESIFAAVEATENFVGIWGVRRPRQPALKAGSVFALTKSKPWTEEELTVLRRIMYGGEMSLRPEEGFGQLRQWPEQKFSPDCGESEREEITVKPTAETVAKTKAIFAHYAENEWGIAAAADAEKAVASAKVDLPTSFFGRLAKMLRDKSGAYVTAKAYGQEVALNLRREQPFERHLQNCRLAEGSLKELLLGGIVPDGERDSWQKIRREADEINAALDTEVMPSPDRLFAVYWSNFFKYGRKAAGAERKNDGE